MKKAGGRQWVVFASIGFMSACANHPVKSNLPLDLSHPGGIKLTVTSEKSDIDTGVIGAQIAKNLATWKYPIASETSAPVSHQLTAQIGNTERASTPAGFSFSMGNSDPRALDFQKADVVNIVCKLETIEKSEQSAELSMGFSDSAITGNQPDLKALSDHASTVCFNLLREVKWPVNIEETKQNGADDSASPGWIPEIRIETEAESAPAAVDNNPPANALQHPQTASEPEPVKKSESESKTVTKEINKEGRKVYIIHNQGNPVIFKFGHDRQ